MGKLKILPPFKIDNTITSVYDTDSKTCIEMTKRVYDAMRELQIEYEHGLVKDQKEFEHCIIKIMNDYIESIDMTIDKQNLDVSNAVEYMKDNLISSINSIVEQMKELGEIDEVVQNSYYNLNDRVSYLENHKASYEYLESTKTLKLNV